MNTELIPTGNTGPGPKFRPGLPLLAQRIANRAWWLTYDLKDFLTEFVGYVPSHWMRTFAYRHLLGVRIGKRASVHRHTRMYNASCISIGSGTVVNRDVLLDGRFGLVIGNNVSISEGVLLLTMQHDVNDPGFKPQGGKTTVQDRVFIGARAIILPGVTLCEGCAVGAGSIVTGDVEAYSVVAGSPARLLRFRSRELSYELDYRKFLG